ncbi:MAG TPA: hypothetical protein VFJ57_12070 [Solirubrobacterales bacterium]|nr:hypothetical protein [Solirubrobacterales bacterium]
MAGKRDDVFLLGEEELGTEPPPASEEPTATDPLARPARSFRPRVGLRVLGALVLIIAGAAVIHSGGDGDDPAPTSAETPPIVAAPKALPAARPRRAPDRSGRARGRRGHPPQRHKAMKTPLEPAPAPLAETASAPEATYIPALESSPQSAPEGAPAAPAPAAALPPARPEFGIER